MESEGRRGGEAGVCGESDARAGLRGWLAAVSTLAAVKIHTSRIPKATAVLLERGGGETTATHTSLALCLAVLL